MAWKLLDFFKKEAPKVETLAVDAAQLLTNPALRAAELALMASFATSGVATTLLFRHDLTTALAAALLGSNHPAVLEHVDKLTSEVATVATAVQSLSSLPPSVLATPVAPVSTVSATQSVTAAPPADVKS